MHNLGSPGAGLFALVITCPDMAKRAFALVLDGLSQKRIRLLARSMRRTDDGCEEPERVGKMVHAFAQLSPEY